MRIQFMLTAFGEDGTPITEIEIHDPRPLDGLPENDDDIPHWFPAPPEIVEMALGLSYIVPQEPVHSWSIACQRLFGRNPRPRNSHPKGMPVNPRR